MRTETIRFLPRGVKVLKIVPDGGQVIPEHSILNRQLDKRLKNFIEENTPEKIRYTDYYPNATLELDYKGDYEFIFCIKTRLCSLSSKLKEYDFYLIYHDELRYDLEVATYEIRIKNVNERLKL